MKLIKLSTYNPNAEFNANFDTDIIINTGTSIALKNLVFNVITTEFESSTIRLTQMLFKELKLTIW